MEDRGNKGFFASIRSVFWVMIILLIYIIVLVVCHLVSPGASFASNLQTQSDREYEITGNRVNLQDAGEVLHFIQTGNTSVEFNDNTVVLMDELITTQVMDAVAKYNEQTRKTVDFDYEYMHYTGKVTSFDPITGDITVEDILVEREVVVPVQVGVEPIYMELPFGGRVLIATLPIYEYETQIVTETIPATEEVLKEHVSLSRSTVENDAEHFGEDIFYLRWQPVLVLCYMIIQNKMELIGTYADGYYLSDEDVKAAIDIFNYRYYFYDDCTIDTGGVLDPSFQRIKQASGAYRLDVSPANPLEDGVTDIVVKRVPVIAPKYILNSYLKYDYQYEQLDNGYYQMTERTCTLDPQGFIGACSELVPDFDPDLFLEELSLLPGTEDMVEYYHQLIYGQRQEYSTRDPAQCPSIGVTVSTVTGFNAWLFHRNNVSNIIANDVSGNPSGGNSSVRPGGSVSPGGNLAEGGTSYTPSAEALSDAQFQMIYEAGVACMDPPTEYVFGSNAGPGISFDCSAFVSYCLRQAGHPIGRLTTISLWSYCSPIDFADAAPGDLIFFQGTYREGISHVGIWLGDNRYMHESSSAGQVTISEYSGYMTGHYYGMGRLPALE